jgi:hypothetical protein
LYQGIYRVQLTRQQAAFLLFRGETWATRPIQMRWDLQAAESSVLYQGTTLVGPKTIEIRWALTPEVRLSRPPGFFRNL